MQGRIRKSWGPGPAPIPLKIIFAAPVRFCDPGELAHLVCSDQILDPPLRTKLHFQSYNLPANNVWVCKRFLLAIRPESTSQTGVLRRDQNLDGAGTRECSKMTQRHARLSVRFHTGFRRVVSPLHKFVSTTRTRSSLVYNKDIGKFLSQ